MKQQDVPNSPLPEPMRYYWSKCESPMHGSQSLSSLFLERGIQKSIYARSSRGI